MRLAKPAAFFVAFSCVGVIQANAVFTLGNVPQPGEENVPVEWRNNRDDGVR